MPSITGSVIAAGIGAGGSIIGGAMNSGAASDAADAQVQAANKAAETQLNIYNQTRSDLAPYLNMGTGALSQLSKMLGIGTTGAPDNSQLFDALRNYPGYQFSFDEGLRALNQSGAARGLLNSGATIQNATKFGQGMAQSVLGNYLDRLGNIATMGGNAGAQTGNAGVATGANVGNAYMNAGSAAGAGIMGSNMAMTGGINQALNNSLLAYQLSQPKTGSLDYVASSPMNSYFAGMS